MICLPQTSKEPPKPPPVPPVPAARDNPREGRGHRKALEMIKYNHMGTIGLPR